MIWGERKTFVDNKGLVRVEESLFNINRSGYISNHIYWNKANGF